MSLRCLLPLFALFSLAPAAIAQVWFVDQTNNSGLEDGMSWETAFITIQPAIDSAFEDAMFSTSPLSPQVWVAAGTYDEERDNPTRSLLMKKDVELYGGFDGTETALEQRDPTANVTTIKGVASNDTFSGYTIVLVAPGEDNTVLDGFTITADNITNLFDFSNGLEAAVAVRTSGRALINQCIFEHNQATAGALSIGGQLTVSNCIFRDNGNGPAMANCSLVNSDCADLNSEVHVKNSVFEGNVIGDTLSGDALFGAAIWMTTSLPVWNGRLIVSNSVFRNNEGGDIRLEAGRVRFQNTEFDGSEIPTDQSTAITVLGREELELVLSGVVVHGYRSQRGGAVYFTDAGIGRIENSLFYNNSASFLGEAIAVTTGSSQDPTPLDVTIVNSTIVDNDGGASETIGVEIGDPDGQGPLTNISVVNSIVRGPIAGNIPIDISFSNFPGGAKGIGNIDSDPLFVNATMRDYRLLPESPEIDAGNTAEATMYDILGAGRPHGLAADMGAYELVTGDDADLDGIPDNEETAGDFDHDGFPNFLDHDSDNDGLDDGVEVSLGTDPLNPDTDGDGMPDGFEVENGLNELADDAQDDADMDGLTNIREYDIGSEVNNADSPSQVFVDPTGDDENGDGSAENPFQTIARAMGTAKIHAAELFDFNPSTIRLAPGIYEEKVVMEPFVAIRGSGPSDTTIRYFDVNDAEHIVLEAAEGAHLEDLTLTLPSLLADVTVLMRISDVPATATNVRFDGQDNLNSIGLLVGGTNSSDSIVSNSVFQRLQFGVQAVDTAITLTMNTFTAIRGDAVFVRLPDEKGAGSTPNLGVATDENTGFNTFGSVVGFFILNADNNVTRAENNDWGLDDPAAIQAKMSGLVDFEPFVGQIGEGAGEGAGEGTGEGAGEGMGEGVGEGAGEGTGEGAGEGMSEGAGEGTGEGEGDGMGEGVGEGMGEGAAEGGGEGLGEGAAEGAGEGMGAEGAGEGMGAEGVGEGANEGAGAEGEGEGDGETDENKKPGCSAGISNGSAPAWNSDALAILSVISALLLASRVQGRSVYRR